LKKVYKLEEAIFSTKGNGRELALSNLSELVAEQSNVFLEAKIMEDQFSQRLEIGG